MADEPNWDDIFSEQPEVPEPKSARPQTENDPTGTPLVSENGETDEAPLTRRQVREAEAARKSRSPQQEDTEASTEPSTESSGDAAPARSRRRLWFIIGIPILLIAIAGATVAAYGWTNYENKIREVLGWELANDFEGSGNGEEVIVTVNSDDIGSDIARSLNEAGVTMSFDAFYDLLLAQDSDPIFLPGKYALQGEMSAQSALDALLN